MRLLSRPYAHLIGVLITLSYSFGILADGDPPDEGLDIHLTSEEIVPETQASDELVPAQENMSPTTQELMQAENPTAKLEINPTWIDPGQSTTLSWQTENVTQCSGSGPWLDSESTAGSVTVGPFFEDSSYVLECQGEGGSAIAMATVRVRTAKLSWSQPTQKSDGSPLLDLVSYRIYLGAQSGIYEQSFTLPSDYSQVRLFLVPGQYYFAISSFDSSDNESDLSQEVSKLIQ